MIKMNSKVIGKFGKYEGLKGEIKNKLAYDLFLIQFEGEEILSLLSLDFLYYLDKDLK